MIIKVCGMRETENIEAIGALKPDFMGFIFYPDSPRCADETLNLEGLPESIKKVGVFVNRPVEEVIEIVNEHQLDYVQLHGTESTEYCDTLLSSMDIGLIKAFGLDGDFDFKTLEEYLYYTHFFLFDTRSDKHGGSGRKFDWSILDNYQYDVPFLLSGGISLDDIDDIREINHPAFLGIDINSRFEIEPGVKDVGKVQQLIKEIR